MLKARQGDSKNLPNVIDAIPAIRALEMTNHQKTKVYAFILIVGTYVRIYDSPTITNNY